MNRVLTFMLVALVAFSGSLLLAQGSANTGNTVTTDSTIDSTRITTGTGTTTHHKRKKHHKKVTTTTTTTTTKSGATDTTRMNDSTGAAGGGSNTTTIHRHVRHTNRLNDTTGMIDTTGTGTVETFRHDTSGTTGPRSSTGTSSDYGTGNTGVNGGSATPPATSPDTTMMGTDTTGQTTSHRRTAEPGVGQETNQRSGRDVSGSGSTAGVPAPPTSGTATGTLDRSVDTMSMQGPGDTLRADSTYHHGQRIRGSATTDTDTIRGHDVTQGQPNNTTDTMGANGPRSYRGNESDWNSAGSGLEWRDIKIGDGAKANDGDKIQVRYTGWLQENNGRGRKFDSSIDRNKDFTFTLGAGQVIKGWDEGIVGMREGGMRELLIPSSLGYGEAGAGGGVIPPNSTLIFQVELVKVNPTH